MTVLGFDDFGGFDVSGGSGQHPALLPLVLQDTGQGGSCLGGFDGFGGFGGYGSIAHDGYPP